MKNLILFCMLSVLFMINNAYAQEQTWEYNQSQNVQTINVNHLFGLSASSVSGVGLSYMYYFNPNYHFKITGLPYQNRDEKTNEKNEKAFNNTILLNGGVELRRNFAVINRPKVSFQFYNLAGGSYWYLEKKRPFDPEENKLRRWYTGGLGFGIGFIFVNKISINIDLCYQYARWIDYGKRYARPGGGISCYYAF